MKKSIILFVAALNFPALEITAHAGKLVNEKGMPFGNGFPGGYHYNRNILGKQGRFTCPPPDYDLILSGLVDRSGTPAFSSDGIALNGRSTKI